MRHTIKPIPALFSILTVLFSLAASPGTEDRTATIRPTEGVYVYFMSTPVDAYDYIDTYKIGTTWTGQPDELLSKMVRKVKKQFPDADGIIISSKDLDQCDVIKFK